MSNLIPVFTLLLALSCVATDPDSMHESAEERTAEYELGATDFLDGDHLELKGVHSDTGDFSPGSTVLVTGTYTLGSHKEASIYLGTTSIESGTGTTRIEPSQRVVVAQGQGEFELSYRVPSRGYPHVTFYDLESGGPLGGVYFGSGETLLVTKNW